MTTMTSEIYIRGTAADPAVRAQASMAARGTELLMQLSAKVALATELDLPLWAREETQDGLLQFCTQRLLPYLEVVDQALYSVAAGTAETGPLVRGLRAHHRLVAAYVGDLDRASNASDVVAAAYALQSVLGACRAVEEVALLPELAMLPGVDLPGLLEDVDTLLAGGVLNTPEEVDVRELPHGRRHPRVFGVYARLGAGESFVLVNNHDPQPLRRELDVFYPDQFSWEYLDSGPTLWRVRISRLPSAA